MKAFLKSPNRLGAERSRMIIRNSILNNLKLEKAQLSKDTLVLNQYIGISRHSDLALFQKLVKEIIPPPAFDNVYLKPLYKSTDQELNLVWLKNEIPIEHHNEHLESVFILEGSCDCYIDDLFIQLEEGGYIQMPLGSHHKIVTTSDKPVKAIVSLVKVDP